MAAANATWTNTIGSPELIAAWTSTLSAEELNELLRADAATGWYRLKSFGGVNGDELLDVHLEALTVEGRLALFAEVRHLDAGSWFGPEWKGERVPSLEEAIAAAEAGKHLILEKPITLNRDDAHAVKAAIAALLPRVSSRWGMAARHM